MREVWSMWRYSTMVVLTVLTAGLFAAILIPLKGIPLIPGITELRPANVISLVFGLLFGPAGAWGSAFGNLIDDFFGTLGPGSFLGFWGNFLAAYLPCQIYGAAPWSRFAPAGCGLSWPHYWGA
jgi:energy-coupling factor transport system substrate-specific component